jgi:hypothetical protein
MSQTEYLTVEITYRVHIDQDRCPDLLTNPYTLAMGVWDEPTKSYKLHESLNDDEYIMLTGIDVIAK